MALRFAFPPIGSWRDSQVQELTPDPHGSQTVPPDMVLKASNNGGGRSDSPPPSEGSHPDSEGNSSTASVSQGSEPDSMAALVRSYRQAGFSKEAAAIAGEARQSSSRRMYSTGIRKFYRWCKRHKVAPH